jgi:sugar lactone lactonase YvrE
MASLQIGEPVCIAATGDECGEGILWSQKSQSVYWTDINRFLVHRYRPADRALQTWFFHEPVTCVLSTNQEHTLALTIGSGLILWKPETDFRSEPLFRLPGWPKVRSNDAGVDSRGSLWLGTMRNNVGIDGAPGDTDGRDGILYRIEGDGNFTIWREGLGVGNTVLWSADDTKFYFADSLRNEIWSYRFDMSDGAICDEQSFFAGFERGLPDGSTLDTEGYLWNCRYGGNCVVRIAPDGSVDRIIEMPVAAPTNCTFGGKDANILYITSADIGSERWERFGGCLFALETNVTGVPANAFHLQAAFPLPSK